MKICLAGEGAQGFTHIEALRKLEGIEVVTLAGGIAADAEAFARKWEIPHWSLDLEECLRQPGVEAVILTTPNQIHAAQTELALNLGKHVLVELPMGLNLAQAERVAALEEKTGLVCMVCHSLRYSPAHREVYRRVQEGSLQLHHLISLVYFFRRENTNRFGKRRTWTDDLLWHQGCHMVDFVSWLWGGGEVEVWAQAGPPHAKLGIAMDLTVGMRSAQGAIASLIYSFNNHGPLDISYRFVGEEASLRIEKGKLLDHEGREIPLGGDGTEAQDREFFGAIAQGRQPLTSCRACLPTMQLLDRMQRRIDGQGRSGG
ncbi:MAG: Gfo/Idh/MocA family oxidoreductase [Candidatus Handelsmanbacteria bacterium]|nr:Gfo/Idh/MocA family oxidoreductase [Candidatus Handelsmanbacteria bacterium]